MTDAAEYARKQAMIWNPATPATGPFLVIKSVPGDSRNRPANLVWGYMYDPDQRYLWNQKYGTFGLRGKSSRIRCAKCGARVHGPDQLVDKYYCASCAAIIRTAEENAPVEKPSPSRESELMAEWGIADADARKAREDRDFEINEGGVWLLTYVCCLCKNMMMWNGSSTKPRVWCPRCHVQVTATGLAKMFPGAAQL